jgi:membrane-bound lytic murein transglycosylase F
MAQTDEPQSGPAPRISRVFEGLLYAAMALVIALIVVNAEKSSLDKVERRGVLKVITRNSPTTYYEGLDGKTGFEYDLAERFAGYLGVELEIVVPNNFGDMIPMLNGEQAELIAAGLTVTEPRKRFVRFGPSYQQISQQLIYHPGKTRRPDSIEDVIGGRLEVVAGSSFEERLEELKTEHPALEWTANERLEVDQLLQRVAAGDIDYTIVDSNDFELNRRFYPDLSAAFDIGEPQQLAWAFRKGRADDALYGQAEAFFEQIEENGTLTYLLEKHYGYARQFKPVETTLFLRHARNRLPPYRYMFIEAGREYGFDWRLLAALAYQESHWITNAVSPTGVRGMMMLTERTAGQLGVRNRLDARESISGGARYLKHLRERLPEDITEPDRTWMALASYNVGYGHLEDARKITESQGDDPHKWLDVKKYLPLLSKKDWYPYTKHGYARGWEPVIYVRNIRSYYDILLWMDERDGTAPRTPRGVNPRSIAPPTL